jgi:hypothetical protein
MKWQLKVQLAGGAFLGLIACVATIYHIGGERALLKQRLHASDSTVAALSARGRGVDTIYRRDTLRMRVAVQRWDTVLQAVVSWDTLRVSVPADTVRVFVSKAEEAINACLIVAQTCEQRVANRDSIIVQLKAQRPLLLGNKESRWKRWGKNVVKVTAGASVGYIVAKQTP